MRSSTDANPDPEAQRPPASPGRGCHPLPWALSAALLLFAGACAACVIRAWVVPGAPALAGPSPGPAPSSRLPEVPELPPDASARLPDSPQGVFAQLVAQDVQLTEGPLPWFSHPGVAGVSLAPGLSYDEKARELVVAEAGVYYVFLRVELRRVVAAAGSGSVSIDLRLQPLSTGAAALAMTLDLPPAFSPPSSEEAPDSRVVGFRGSLLHLGAGQRLGVHLRPGPGAHPAWQLAQTNTVLGLFRVATKVPAGLPFPLPT
ncbi:PREDICTED: tumor necrosis factor ligand superfamily member 9 [Ceratotherium simum simum]|uniref:Tumor necrosis factor ligand superfamily member 9 n=1 Tax=Ceratotherium simum simum TaxID=73337 RepID=A0ABM1DHY9_CERSS|nr:PREDICTED: tumor necrosis factor ligand superfamily member 9 [Ceratotherium simum simum]